MEALVSTPHGKPMADLQALIAAQRRTEQVLSDLVAAQRDVEATLAALPDRLRRAPADTAVEEVTDPTRSPKNGTKVQPMRDAPSWPRFESHNPGEDQAAPNQDSLVAPMLPLHWPKSIKVQEALVTASGPSPVRVSVSRSKDRIGKRVSDVTDDLGPHAQWLRDPSSSANLAFAVLSMLVLMHDLCIIPYALAWQLQFEGYLLLSSWMSACFWTVDIGLSFIRGYYSDEGLVTAPKATARQYMTKFFVSDLLVSFCDWLVLALVTLTDGTSSEKGLKVLRLAKLARFLRIIGALRMFRVLKTLWDFLDRVMSDTWQWFVSIASSIFAGLLLTHLMACAWMAIGRMSSTDTGEQWVNYNILYDGHTVPFADAPPLYQYMTSYHWALAVLTQGSIEFPCMSSFERVFNIASLIIGFLGGSVFVSSLSARMVEYETLQRDRVQQLRRLRRYLDEHNVPPRLSVITLRQATQRLRGQKPLTSKDVPVLDILSSVLRKELHASLCKPQLLRHPLFRVFDTLDAPWLDGFCRGAITVDFLSDCDELFNPGAVSKAMYMLMQGQMSYRQVPDSSPVTEQRVRFVREGAWICESALWSQWIHVGAAEATMHCRLVTLRTNATVELLQRHHTIRNVSRAYCIEFHKRIVTARPPLAEWPDDLAVPSTAFEELVMSLPHVLGMMIGFQAVDQILSNTRGRDLLGVCHADASRLEEDCHQLKEEIQAGKCTMCLDAQGKILRITTMVLTRVEDENGLFFWQLGKTEHASLSAVAQMPGIKRKRGESLEHAMVRLFAGPLAPLAGASIEGTEQNVAEGTSSKYGVHTRYLRTICNAKFQGALQAPHCALPPRGRKALNGDSRLEEFVGRRVYVLQHEGGAKLYAWLTAEEIEYFDTCSGGEVLESWLADLPLPAEDGSEFDMAL